MGTERNRAFYQPPKTFERESAQVQPAFADGLPPIDRVHLSRYSLGSIVLEREIMGLFLAQLPLSIEQLRFAATDREWQVAAHTIKGSAKAVGARYVARIAVDAERTSGVLDDAERLRILAALEEACEAIETYVEEAFVPDAPARA